MSPYAWVGIIAAVGGALVVIVALYAGRWFGVRVRPGEAMPEGAERRQHIRFRTDIPGFFRVMEKRGERAGASTSVSVGEEWVPCTLKDVSEGGLCAEIAFEDPQAWEAMEEGNLVPSFRVQFEGLRQGLELTAKTAWGKVIRTEPNLVVLAGFQFRDLDERERATIIGYIRRNFYGDYQPAGKL